MGVLDGKIVIVTGASSGIGAAIVRLMAAEGAAVVMAARRTDRMETLAVKLGAKALPVRTDVRKEEDIIALFDAAENRFGTPHVLVNCAGIADHTPTEKLSLDRWQEILATNLTSVFLCSREALRRMKPLKRGRIITIGSIASKMPKPDAIGYAATKAALHGMNHSIALDARPYGITSSIVHPGSTVSELLPDMPERPRSITMATEDVSRTVVFMASLPNETNVLEVVMLPIAQPYLCRG